MEDATYHQRMSKRTADKIKLLRSHWDVKGKVCLDIGAGRGDITMALIEDGAEWVEAVEMSDSFLSAHPDRHTSIRDSEGNRKGEVFQNDIVGLVKGEVWKDITYGTTLCLSVMHHVIGHYGWEVAMETWERILAASEVVYFEIGLPSEQGQFYWKDAMKSMDDDDVRKRFTLNARVMYWEQIGALPIHGIERPIYYLRRLES